MELQHTGRQLRTALGNAFGGTALIPGDPGYDQARRVWNATVDKHPALVARCTSADDVAAAVRAAREVGVPLTARGGGHQVAGLSVCDGGLTIDLSGLRSVALAADLRSARAGGGSLLGDVDTATQKAGRIVPAGVISHTGLGGLALGGGVGWTFRNFGLTCDNIRGAEVVTADGKTVYAGDGGDTDLLWALRGGGGNFGVVTAFDLDVHPVSEVLFGQAWFALDDLPRAAYHYTEALQQAPRALTSVLVLRVAPDTGDLPVELRGQPIALINAAWSGPLDEGDGPLRKLIEGAGPAHSTIVRMPYLELQTRHDDFHPHGQRNYLKSRYLDRVDEQAVQALLKAARSQPGTHSQIEVVRLGGAMADVAEDATAFAHRDANYILNISATWDDPDETDLFVSWARGVYSSLDQAGSDAGYVNFLEDEPDRVRSVYPDRTYTRLQQIKLRVDPGNVFRGNVPIEPASR